MIDMESWLLISSIVFLTFSAKCFKELVDVKAMSRMDRKERAEILRKRNFYDNHA